ncbi:hypothetical protein [Microbacterium azadirachtae]|uniref:hypothetical protein n=1 Tax=Microbacterium azadirachtae TaxID=582680 RepID=UPI00126A3F26|nr:hypothetical protein [Microbacterium azadirachtae]
MSRAAKVATGIAAAVVVAGLVVLAYPAFAALGGLEHPSVSAASAAPSKAATTEPTAAPSPSPTKDDGSDDCPTEEATISITGKGDGAPTAKLVFASSLTDKGARPGARGEVVSNAQGIYSYIVAPNDNLISIEQRLCIDYGSVRVFDHVLGSAIQPGAQLILRPDPTIPWIEPVPFDAIPNVTNIVEFSSTIYEMGVAVRTHDLDTARALWSRSLSGHVAPAAQAAATKALDDGDWPVLEQLFP